MDSRLLVAVWSALFVIIKGHPIAVPEEINPNIVPGVFISTEALKDLQEKAQQNQMNAQTARPITNERQPITNTIDPSLNTNENRKQLKIGAASNPISSVPIVSQTQPILSHPAANQPILSNQPQILTPQVIPNQQPNQAYLVTQQPGQAMLVQQPSYQQPILVNQPNLGSQIPNQQQGNQLYISQPPSNQVFLNQAGNQMPPNTQVLLQNGQIAQILPQPYTNQPMLSNNVGSQVVAQNPTTNIPSGATLYAMVPVNGPSNLGVPNTNLGSGNSYLMPVQQQPANQIYTISVK